MAKAAHFTDIEDRLRLFVVCIERGQQPPGWLLEFMAAGAREFLRGGKPWQKGKGGRPKGGYGEDEIKPYLLHYYGRLTMPEIGAALGLLDPDGKDVARNLRRTAKRGELAFCMAKIGRVALLKKLFAELLALDLDDLPEAKRRKCVQGLRRGLADLELDEREPEYD